LREMCFMSVWLLVVVEGVESKKARNRGN
jgi:hypothetical protein